MLDLLELLKMTPSGGQLQAWEINYSQIDDIYYLNISTLRSENNEYTDRFSYGRLVSLGILKYSIDYLAPALGFSVLRYATSEDPKTHFPIFKFELLRIGEPSVDIKNRIQVFKKRFTDRSLYKSEKLDSHVLGVLKARRVVNLNELEKKSAIELQKNLGLVRYQNKYLFKEMLSEISTHHAENGIPIKNLCLDFLLEITLKISKLLPITFPFKFIYSYPIHQSIIKPLVYSSEICILSEESNDFISWVQLGYRFMHVWLELTEMNVHLQPFGGTLIISNYYKDKSAFKFTRQHIDLIKNSEFFLTQKHAIDLKKPNIFFRIGYSNLHQPVVMNKTKTGVEGTHSQSKEKL